MTAVGIEDVEGVAVAGFEALDVETFAELFATDVLLLLFSIEFDAFVIATEEATKGVVEAAFCSIFF